MKKTWIKKLTWRHIFNSIPDRQLGKNWSTRKSFHTLWFAATCALRSDRLSWRLRVPLHPGYLAGSINFSTRSVKRNWHKKYFTDICYWSTKTIAKSRSSITRDISLFLVLPSSWKTPSLTILNDLNTAPSSKMECESGGMDPKSEKRNFRETKTEPLKQPKLKITHWINKNIKRNRKLKKYLKPQEKLYLEHTWKFHFYETSRHRSNYHRERFGKLGKD